MIDALKPARSAAGRSDRGALIAWLERVREQRNLNVPPPSDIRAGVIGTLLDAISKEFAEYQEVVAGARQAAVRNGEQLVETARATRTQGNLARATAQAIREAGEGAVEMARAAAALCGFSEDVAASATDAGRNLSAIDEALGQLAQRLVEGDGPLVEMRRSTAGVAQFLLTLARLSRNAQLLAVNAAIESSHLAEAGERFAIVAQEVRNLSTSTRDSKADVSKIVGELRTSTHSIFLSTSRSKDGTAAAGVEIGAASEALSRTTRPIGQFTKTVADVADLAQSQSGALGSIEASIGGIERNAESAATAAGVAAKLDLDGLLASAAARAGRWTLRSKTSVAVENSAFARWVGALVDGVDPAAKVDADDEPEDAGLIRQVRALLEQINADQRAILGDIIAVAVAASRNGYAWRSIGQSIHGVTDEIDALRDMTVAATTAARTALDLAKSLRGLVDAVRGEFETALALLEGALTRITRIIEDVGEIGGSVTSMSSAATRADQIMALIDSLSSETDLLSLNAAIEAAHAGTQGLGFSVIAEEIRTLARSTNNSTTSVSGLVSDITRSSVNLRSSIAAAADGIEVLIESADRARETITTMRRAFEAAVERAADVSNIATSQAVALTRVLENIDRCGDAIDVNAAEATDRGRLELGTLGARAHAIAARRPLGTVVERVRSLAQTLCTRVEAALEELVAGGRISLDRLFDLQYHEIVGDEIATLRRLFDVSRVPASGFTPPKYATPWDGIVDDALIDVLTVGWDEARAAEIGPVALFISDLNGLFYAYPRQKIAAWTNDPANDNLGNRIKRMFEDEYSLRVGRLGLGSSTASIGTRLTYEEMHEAGCKLGRPTQRPWGGYVYARDTNAVCNEIAMAVYVRDMRHSTLRLCYDANLT